MCKHATWLIPAALVGLVAGFVGSSLRHPVPLYAMTAHGSERKTLVTVPLDAGMEAVVALDHVTADLTGYVLDRFTGGLTTHGGRAARRKLFEMEVSSR